MKEFAALVAVANGSELVWRGGIELLGNGNDMGVVDE